MTTMGKKQNIFRRSIERKKQYLLTHINNRFQFVTLRRLCGRKIT